MLGALDPEWDAGVEDAIAENAKRPAPRYEDYRRATAVPIEITCTMRLVYPVTGRAACRR